MAAILRWMRKGGRLNDDPWAENRNNALREIRGLGDDNEGKKIWKKLNLNQSSCKKSLKRKKLKRDNN